MIRFGLIGCGRISRRHIDILANGTVGGARLVAVCDPRHDRLEAARSQLDIAAYADIEDVLADKSVDVVSILTPSGMHAEHAIKAARAGKHVVVEKPMALRLEDADAMIRECDAAGVRLFVIKQNRFNPPIRRAREALEAGRFGQLILGTVRVRWCRDQAYYDQDSWRGTRAYDGGVLANQASHHIDLLEWFMGDAVSVYARASRTLVDIETENTVVATLRFANGALGVVEATCAARPGDIEGSLSVLGASGSVVIGGFAVNKVEHWRFSDALDDCDTLIEPCAANPPNVYGDGHKQNYQNIADCLNGRSVAVIDGLEGRRSVRLITALYESIEAGREVSLRT